MDLLNLDDRLTADQRLVRDTAQGFVRDSILPDVATWFEEGTFPARDLGPVLGSLGMLGMHLSGYGCAGLDATSYGVACRELEAGDSGLRSFVSVQGSLAMFPMWKYGSSEVKEEWLPQLAAGTAIGCFGLTEPDHGSDPSNMKTFAKQDPSGDWILNGSKMWITNGSVSDVAVVWAQTDEGIRGFVVPTSSPGFSASLIHRKLSLRASVTSSLYFDDVRVPASSVLDVVGLRGPLACLSEARFGILWGVVGAGRACFEAALEYSKTRVQFGKPIAAFQLTQEKLAWMAVALGQAGLTALHLGSLKDAGVLRPQQVSFGKLANVRAALDVAREARSILGANGVTLEYPVIRHMNNLESVLTYEGTQEIHTLVLGEALTGVAAYR
ncbi:acyl-CoA dehydrogenase family protein [Herbidospora mongoliensis]|uniref:acyl-CoA dehydrogenase family protein n=1 Tax=Herbidospora mongoliensis TaxID=688067 RepID=UPI00083529AF|nr:acyl-CoA dehydrogenase family protein [Herbidospora mongoliensis]